MERRPHAAVGRSRKRVIADPADAARQQEGTRQGRAWRGNGEKMFFRGNELNHLRQIKDLTLFRRAKRTVFRVQTNPNRTPKEPRNHLCAAPERKSRVERSEPVGYTPPSRKSVCERTRQGNRKEPGKGEHGAETGKRCFFEGRNSIICGK